MSIDSVRFRQLMGHFASGVTVVTTAGEGERQGMTVSAFSSLSLDPPLVLICVERTVRIHAALEANGKFGVNILADDQEELSRRFASRVDDRFSGVGVTDGSLGVPLLTGALAVIECRIVDRLPGGDHTIFVGEVVDGSVREGDPLLYFRGGYRALK
jgi:flavin reductase (DIM6/NTAB) family NADH-FMN oxidoreductase RutF